MREDLTIEYGEHEGAKLIRLPYGNGAYSMVMILPAEGTDVTGLLTESQYRPITSNGAMKTERVKVEIPKFDITDENILNSPLASLGISNIFGNYRRGRYKSRSRHSYGSGYILAAGIQYQD